MTDILQKAELIREQRFGSQGDTLQITQQKKDTKEKAKVTKKNIGINKSSVTEGKVDNPVKEENKDGEKEKAKPKPTNSNGQGMFGGMKKGFLFGGPSKQSAKSSSSNGKQSEKLASKENTQKSSATKTSVKEEMPFITPSGKTEPGLAFDEVQQAMSEAKGLLNNQEWITDDFLDKIEKNDSLLKRFSDPHFMSALQEFQTNPQAAMAKYKGNQEVEKFLMEFCGLLGDHFTNLDGSNKNPQSKTKKEQVKSEPTIAAASMLKAQNEPLQAKKTPKIVEIGSGDEGDDKKQKTTKTASSDLSKISEKLNTVANSNVDSESHIRLHDPQSGADMQEIHPQNQKVPQTDDEAVKEVLNDPKVMETLMDPKIMTLIKTLREDPEKAQRLIDKADLDLKEKVRVLVSKGLLQFQTS